jgi:plasmid stabilization system protein ParE
MLETKRRPPRAPEDHRMNLYHDTFRGRLRWYVKISRTGRRVDITEEYSADERSDFHQAWEAAVRALGGVPRMRRTRPDEVPATTRRYLISDVSDWGQLRWYVQLRDKLPKIRIHEEFGSDEFNRAVDAAIVDQIGKFGDATDWVRAEKQRREKREPLPNTPPVPGSLRWYWTLYKQSDRWLGNAAIGEEGLAESTRDARIGLIEPLLCDNGEHPFAALTRKALREELKARTPVQAGNLLSALRHMIGWMIDEEHIEPDDDPTIGLKSGKAKASRESGGWVPWTEEDMAKYRARWPLGTEARLMFDILHYTHLRLGDASRFGAAHLQRTLKTLMVKVATEKSKGRTTATVPVHRDFALSLAAARNAGILGMGEVFTGKLVNGEIVPMNKKAWAAKFKKFARLAGVNEPKKNCHGVRKARAEVAAYSDCTEAQMMAMFGWRDHKMPALYIAKASLDKLAIGGMAKIEAYDQTENIADLAMPIDQNRIVTLESNRRKKS